MKLKGFKKPLEAYINESCFSPVYWDAVSRGDPPKFRRAALQQEMLFRIRIITDLFWRRPVRLPLKTKGKPKNMPIFSNLQWHGQIIYDPEENRVQVTEWSAMTLLPNDLEAFDDEPPGLVDGKDTVLIYEDKGILRLDKPQPKRVHPDLLTSHVAPHYKPIGDF